MLTNKMASPRRLLTFRQVEHKSSIFILVFAAVSETRLGGQQHKKWYLHVAPLPVYEWFLYTLPQLHRTRLEHPTPAAQKNDTVLALNKYEL